jgi:hypothetical protein
MKEMRKGRSLPLAAGSRGSTCPPWDAAAAGAAAAVALENAAAPLEGVCPPDATAAGLASNRVAAAAKGGKQMIALYIVIFVPQILLLKCCS